MEQSDKEFAGLTKYATLREFMEKNCFGGFCWQSFCPAYPNLLLDPKAQIISQLKREKILHIQEYLHKFSRIVSFSEDNHKNLSEKFALAQTANVNII